MGTIITVMLIVVVTGSLETLQIRENKRLLVEVQKQAADVTRVHETDITYIYWAT